jgi:biopolymer transport protein ExbB/TolQ
MYESTQEPRDYILFNRTLMALTSIRNFGRLGDLEDLLQAQADNDESISDSGYTIIRGLVWAIPVLGFIGTVIGLSAAIGSFGDVIASAGDLDEIKNKLGDVTQGLSIAFVTTLEALVAALAVQLTLISIQRQEEQLLDDTREYCQRELVSRVRITATDWSSSLDQDT